MVCTDVGCPATARADAGAASVCAATACTEARAGHGQCPQCGLGLMEYTSRGYDNCGCSCCWRCLCGCGVTPAAATAAAVRACCQLLLPLLLQLMVPTVLCCCAAPPDVPKGPWLAQWCCTLRGLYCTLPVLHCSLLCSVLLAALLAVFGNCCCHCCSHCQQPHWQRRAPMAAAMARGAD